MAEIEERIVPVKTWLRPATYRTLERAAHRQGIPNVGVLLTQLADRIVAGPTTVPVPVKARKGPAKLPPEEAAARRTARWEAFAADTTDPRHGTHNGYANLRCRCEPCRTANAQYEADRKAS